MKLGLGLQLGVGLPAPGGGFPEAAAVTSAVMGEVDASVDGSGNHFSAQVMAQRYLAPLTGEIDELEAWIHAQPDVDMRMGIYADAAGEPGALLAQSVELLSTPTGQWVAFALVAPLAVTGGVHYWIAGHAANTKDALNPGSGLETNLARRLRSVSYASGLPDPFGTGSSYGTTRPMRATISA